MIVSNALIASEIRVAIMSVSGLFIALCIAVIFSLYRLKRPRPIPFAVLRRAILPSRIFTSSSGRTDIVFAVFGLFVFGLMFGWAFVSATTVKSVVTLWLGTSEPLHWPRWAIITGATTCLYLSYEFAYWLYHFLCHRIEFLWRFHAVHHSAESLSPLTNYRVHPVDSILFVNVLAVINGATSGVLTYLFGDAHALTVFGANAVVLVALTLVGTLQHSHFWISFQGIWGKVFLSPAHHQIHHSIEPAHFNKNLGSTLAIWDWLFGTLVLPARRRECLTFGVAGYEKPHTFKGAIISPLVASAEPLISWKMALGRS
jgi:sterol desaturase/sphingolipid hydroxylase (fatty acid hydroxylase superfamily)